MDKKLVRLINQITNLENDPEVKRARKVLEDTTQKRILLTDELIHLIKDTNVNEAIDEWVEDTLAFIKEKGDDIKDGFIAGRVREGTADECLRRMKEHGWKFIPCLVYNPNTTHIHLVPNDYVDDDVKQAETELKEAIDASLNRIKEHGWENMPVFNTE
jgi:hypothetical protein